MKTQNICFSDNLALEEFIAQHKFAGERNLLIQIFTSDVQDKYISNILSFLTIKLPNSVIIGATTDGEIFNGKSISDSTIISFTSFNTVTIKAQLYPLEQSHFKVGRTIASSLCAENSKAMILLADGLTVNGDDLLDGIYDVHEQIVIAGGLAGDYRRMQKTFVICNGIISSNAVVACVLDGKDLIVNNAYAYGWHPIGKQMLVTKAIGNRLYELDNLPLRAVYAKYLGESVAKDLPVSAGEYPLIINRFGKQIARAALNLLEDGSMQYAGNFKVGDKVQFGYGHIPLILSDANKIFEYIKKLPIESGFIYSCSARKYFMRQEVDVEMEPLNTIGVTSGFFTYGEFFHGADKNELLNETMTLLLMSEKASTPQKTASAHVDTMQENENKYIFNTLFHLIEATGNELSETNDKLELLVADKTKQLVEKIYYDSLTKLPNRNLLLEDFSYKSTAIPQMIAIINIDDFKRINDYYGPKIGDIVTLKVAEYISEIIQDIPHAASCKLYKLPIDEYAIAAHGKISSAEFSCLLDLIVKHLLDRKIYIENNNFFLNYTIGISLGHAESTDYLDETIGVLLQANMALRQAKDAKIQKVIYKQDLVLRQQLEYNLLWTKKIKDAISEDRFVPYFQPILASETCEITKYECLIRMIDTDNKVIAPYSFLEVAKKSKLYSNLTHAMVRKCFKIFAENKKNFSINVSIADIQNQDTVSFIQQQIQQWNIGKQLTFEILESEDLLDYQELNAFITDMKHYGCKFAIDDFGSGYSNFQHIIKMDIDYLKIDGSLIKNINNNLQNKLMVEMIITFCKKADILTIAEFVSEQDIFNTVKLLGVDFVQGYFFSEPTDKC